MAEKNNFKGERQHLLEKVRSLPPGEAALETLSTVRAEYDWAIDGYRNALNILSDTIYQDRKHFLLELIQNADDADYKTNTPCLTFIINANDIELQYNEIGFDIDDIIAITDLGDSRKKGKERLTKGFIGEKGIGFKSVFALASKVEIESPPWHFLLRKEQCIVPEVLRNGRLKTGTRIQVKFIEHGYISKIAEEIKRYVDGNIESFLYLNKLSKVIVLDRQQEQTVKCSLEIEPPGRNSSTLTLRADSNDGNSVRKYQLFEHDLVFPAELVNKRWERLASNEGALKRKMIVAALMETAEDSLPTGQLFCYLPTKITLPVPLFLQIDGHTTADRERLLDHATNDWNRHLLQAIPRFLMDAISHWRSVPSMKAGLLNYIPTSPGTDQLSGIILKWQEILKSEAWLKTFDDSIEKGWVAPIDALWPDNYWIEWFVKEPNFRNQSEDLLGKRIVHHEWIAHKKWSGVRDCYKIEKLNGVHIAAILRYVTLPKAMLSPENITQLYQYLNDSSEINKSQKLKHEIKKAPIFPLGRGKWGTLLDDDDDNRKVYWLNSRATRPTGLEGHIEYRIIDPEYTYRSEAGGKATELKREESRQINDRNEIVRTLLKILGVCELDDDRILTDLQIPWLVEITEIDKTVTATQYNVLARIFNAYQAKQKKDDEYINLFEPLAEALFLSEKLEAHKLNDLILPQTLRLFPEDHLYANTSAQSISLPEWLITPPPSEAKQINSEKEKERKEKFRQDWRQFLIHCGIKSKPIFYDRIQNFDSAYDFARKEKDLYESWCKNINSYYTSYNSVKVIRSELDILTKDIIKLNHYNKTIMSEILYQTWIDKFQETSKTFQGWTSEETIPGWFKAVYCRYSNQCRAIRDNKWAGLEEDLIPLKTIRGLQTTRCKAFRIPSSKQTELVVAPTYLDIVPEQDDPVKGRDYVTTFLDSLGIRKPTITEVNNLFKQYDSKHYRDIAKIAIELINVGTQKRGLEVYDFKENRIRPIDEFKLGKNSPKGFPLIEEQYGDVGRKLGEIYSLETETEISSFLGLFHEYFENGPDEILCEKIHEMLKGWIQLSEQQQSQIVQDIKEAFSENECDQFIIAFNDKKVMAELVENDIPCISININEADRYHLENSAGEIGLTPVSDFGALKGHGAKSLTEEECIEFNDLIERYIENLTKRDASRLNYRLLHLGHSEVWCRKVKRVKRLQRTYCDTVNRIEDLPFLDTQHNFLFFVGLEDSIENIIAGLLSCCEFTNHKSAIRDIEDLQENKEIGYITSGEMVGSPVIIQDVVQSVKHALKELRLPSIPTNGQGWKLGLPPEDEVKFRQNVIGKLEDSLIKGPDIYEKRLGKRTEKVTAPTFVDPAAPEPKTFLKNEYSGKCQICNVELVLSSGDKWIETYRIVETRQKNWWANRPFNILCLCPNCHALAKHGGGMDFFNIYNHAQNILHGETIPIEVHERQGDYYVVPVLLAGKEQKMYFSKVHLNYFSALFEYEE